MKKYFWSILFLLTASQIAAQSPSDRNALSKNNLYIYWGWNWSSYTDSDIEFKGNSYDISLKDVTAQDRPSPFDVKTYFHPLQLTKPQYNVRVGYFIKDRWDISFGIDHMKYVVDQNQIVHADGFISETGTSYDGTYNKTPVIIEPGFLELEHTDGLNYVNFEIRKHTQLFALKNIELNGQLGAGLGGYMPKTDATFLNFERNDDWHWAGFGTHLVTGLNLTLFQKFFIQSELKGGYINLPDIKTTASNSDGAKQKFLFSQINILFGGIIKLNQKAGNAKKPEEQSFLLEE
ncbi:MAG: hypothetical protein L7S43_04645 [Flavobacteriaceae bacterium]|jgi:hypothetical protein|nr:hypothetical protein [Flavobacteriaceae bacterium]